MTAALAYKAWRESRTRFLLSAATLGWFCSALIVFRAMTASAAHTPYSGFVEASLYEGSIRTFFVIFVVVLGLGGLAQEATRGSAPFTLSLPVTRTRHSAARALVGLAEVFALALTPTTAVLGLAPFVHESYAAGAALQGSLQWAVGGSLFFALSYLMSVVVSGTYAALIASWVLLAAYALAMFASPLGPVSALNAFAVMSADHHSVYALIGAAIPAFLMIAAAAWLTERQDF